MALTTTQRTDFQADLGIGNDQAVFTNAELDRLYARAESGYELAVAFAFRQLMADAAKFNDYTAGESSEKKAQVFDHVRAMAEWWMKEAGGGLMPLSTGKIIQDFQEPDTTTVEYS